MDLSFHPPPERREERRAIPWYRRAVAAVFEIKAFVAACAVTVGAHAWLRGLITRAELDLAVKAQVTVEVRDALAEMRGDLAIIKTNTGGLPDWRKETTEKVIKFERDISVATKDATKANDRIDAYLDKRGHTR